jgi:tRNA (cmo5U34)-methyltransferase
MAVNLWNRPEHALDYLGRADSIPHRTEGESSLLEFIPQTTRRILDLGTGSGRLLTLVKLEHPTTEAVALDFSPAMIEAAKKSFAGDGSVEVLTHNLDNPLPDLGKFDAVVSSFAIHHLADERKRALYSEIHGLLNSGGVFCNLERRLAHAEPSPRISRPDRHYGCNRGSLEPTP